MILSIKEAVTLLLLLLMIELYYLLILDSFLSLNNTVISVEVLQKRVLYIVKFHHSRRHRKLGSWEWRNAEVLLYPLQLVYCKYQTMWWYSLVLIVRTELELMNDFHWWRWEGTWWCPFVLRYGLIVLERLDVVVVVVAAVVAVVITYVFDFKVQGVETKDVGFITL